MSAIAGVYNFLGQPIEPEFLSALGNKLNARGTDGGAEVIRDSIGMGYRAFHTNKESRLEHQPLIRHDNYMLTWDGRLDNRDELISQLSNELCDDQTDVTIVMAAYLRWGIDFLPRLLGDFALALWNARTRTLVLARDPIGPRTLYYHKNRTRIVWATELAALLDLAEVDLEVNDEYLAEFLTRLAEPSLTPYKRLYPVPPGHAVVITDGQFRVQRFWSLDPHKVIRYKQDSEYEEHFRSLFLEAVACRLRVEGTVWAELSGGMDSSAIVCMADEIIKSEHVQASSLQTVSFVFDEASKSDERKYIRYVERKIGRTGLHLREDDLRMLSTTWENYSRILPNPTAIAAEYYTALFREMKEMNGRVLLSGKGGDELLTAFKNPTPELADILISGKIFELHRRLRLWSQLLKTPYPILLWEKAIVPVCRGSCVSSLSIGQASRCSISMIVGLSVGCSSGIGCMAFLTLLDSGGRAVASKRSIFCACRGNYPPGCGGNLATSKSVIQSHIVRWLNFYRRYPLNNESAQARQDPSCVGL